MNTMSQAGARGPGSPPKPPPLNAAKPASPPTPPVAPRQQVAGARAPAGVRPAKTTVLGMQAPAAAQVPAKPQAAGVDDSWDGAPSDDDKTAVNLAAAATSATVKTAAVSSSVTTAPMPVMTATAAASTLAAAATTPVAPPVAAQQAVTPTANVGGGVTAADVRLIVRTIVDEAVLPLVARLTALEKLAAAASATPRPPAAAPQGAPAHAAAAAAPVQHPAAMALTPQPGRVVVAVSAPPPPLLDVKAIERDIPIDFDMTGIDGGKRKRRAVILFTIALVLVFGSLFGMLALSYTHAHN